MNTRWINSPHPSCWNRKASCSICPICPRIVRRGKAESPLVPTDLWSEQPVIERKISWDTADKKSFIANENSNIGWIRSHSRFGQGHPSHWRGLFPVDYLVDHSHLSPSEWKSTVQRPTVVKKITVSIRFSDYVFQYGNFADRQNTTRVHEMM